MPAINSSFNNRPIPKEDECVCGAPIFPLKTSSKDNNSFDIVDEAIMLYRLNIFYKNFELQGKADVILVYLMSFISECLNALPRSTAKTPLTKQVCLKTFQNQVQLTLELPGSYNFNLGMVFDAPKDEREREACRSYFIHLRNECAKRLADEVFDRENSNGEMSKWWKCFQKRKFMYNYGK